MKAIRYAGAAVCLALAAYFMAPLVMGILHIGMVYPAALLALAALCSCGPGGSGGFPGGCGAPAGPCWGRDWPCWRRCW